MCCEPYTQSPTLQKLHTLKRELEQTLAGHRERLTVEHFADPVDNALQFSQRETECLSLRHTQDRLREVTDAIERYGTKAWAVCEECGAEISPKRLEAYPTARLCRECAEMAERRAKEDEAA